jgi:hypothetical protein
MACRHFLSASSVTEQVFTTHISAFSPFRAFRTPCPANALPIADVSAKFNLQPKV